MNRLFFLLLIFSATTVVLSQESLRKFRIVGYNVENYFDLEDDPDTRDEEFLPGGYRGWNRTRYLKKQADISKVIAAVGEWEPPAIVMLSEVESNKALVDLTEKSPLKNLRYKLVHYESPDPRGIDVAILYQPHRFRPYHTEAIRIPFMRTRDILHVAGKTDRGDTLHVFACHFPSKWGGELESEERRLEVGRFLRAHVDSVILKTAKANIVILGDLNDNPRNRSVIEALGALPPTQNCDPTALYNLAYPAFEQGKGTHKFQGEWDLIDHIIVSGNLLQKENGFHTGADGFQIYEADFLMENDEVYFGKKPFRTYIGMRYHGGFSDHLPVFVDFNY